MYSNDRRGAFLILLGTYIVIVIGLAYLSELKICQFSTDINTIEGVIFNLPLMAIYILVSLAALAGYARGKFMVDKLPLNQRLHQELKKCSMDSGNIKAKIRSGAQAKVETSFLDALQNLISSRISILAIVDDGGKVKGVITPYDLLAKLQETIKADGGSLKALAEMKISDLNTVDPVTAKSNENLQSVLSKMVKTQYTKLIVVDENDQFTGTVDVMDMISEFYDNDCDIS